MQWLDRLAHGLRPLLVRIHRAVRRHQLWLSRRRSILLGRLWHRRSPVIDRLVVSSRRLLARFVVRLLRLLLARVTIGLVHWHGTVGLVAVVRRLWLVLGLLWGRL